MLGFFTSCMGRTACARGLGIKQQERGPIGIGWRGEREREGEGGGTTEARLYLFMRPGRESPCLASFLPAWGGLHALEDWDAEEAESDGEGPGREVAEGKSRSPDGVLRSKDGAAVIELVKLGGELEEIRTEAVGEEVLLDGLNDLAQLEEVLGQGKLDVLRQDNRDTIFGAELVEVDAAFPADALDAHVGVKHVRRSVTLQCQHLVVAEHVVARPVLVQVRILDGADPHHLRHVPNKLLVLRPALRLKPRPYVRLGTDNCLVQQVPEPYRVAGSSLQLLPILALNQAELDVLDLDVLWQPPGTLGYLENLVEVGALAGVHHVQQPFPAVGAHTVPQRRQVCRGIVEPAVGLSNNEGLRSTIPGLVTLQHHALTAVVLDQKAHVAEVFDDVGQERVVEGLPALLECHIEPVVYLLKLAP
mmetsp:Transcript_20564/g.35341  ORF Transcript_20564/g.35341 Transcript_20564/m.35341 type:complete len:419 (-) Transcript_20564:1041-2297(-)